MHPNPDSARVAALDERRHAARRDRARVVPVEAPFLAVKGASGFTYRVRVRGDADGPHACTCPDFEANRLHTCKHVERVREWLRRFPRSLPRAHRNAADAPHVWLRFGETIEPRLWGRPTGPGSRSAAARFVPDGAPRVRVPDDEKELLDWLRPLGALVEAPAREWLERRAARRPELPPTRFRRLLPGLGGEPYDYQWTGAEFLARRGRALLADEMGLGKTVQAILAAAALRRAGVPVRSVTVVCPASLRGGWEDEIRRWIGEEATLLSGRSPDREKTIASRPAWLVCHYEQVLRDHRFHAANPPDLLILDEAQRVKGLWGKTARVLKGIPARHLFALTGTPLENRLEEAYAIAQLVDQRLLPALWQIERDHFEREPGGRRVVLYRGLDRIRRRLSGSFLRRRKEEVALELPKRMRSVSRLPMHHAVVGTYEDLMDQVRRIASKKVIPPRDLERMQRLLVVARRCCNGPHLIGIEAPDREIPKLAELEQALRDLCLGEGRKAVVFSEWTDMSERIEALCGRLKLPVFHLRGAVPIHRRPALIRSFSQAKGPAVFVSTDAGGVGLNLQAADVVVNVDLPWNPARLEQRLARVHRIGSRRPVQIVLLVTENSIEERILSLHDVKRAALDAIWAKGGEDRIAAPGGSGAFRTMVEALLETTPPADRAPAAIAPVLAPHAAIDPLALLQAVGAVASTLPPEHRASLGAVFRALADAMEA